MMQWYVIQIYAGYEKKAQADILKRIEEEGLHDLFGSVLIPEAKLKQVFDLSVTKEQQQLFPGYLLINMEMTQQTKKLVLSSPRVLRFLGGIDPVPLTQKEIKHTMSQITGEISITSEKSDFIVGGEIEIMEGPFAGFVGIVDKVDKNNEKLVAMVSIFGRMTPVELSFHQVKQ